MNRYTTYQFDSQTFVVIDQVEKREICICQNHDNYEDAENRAIKIAKVLNLRYSPNPNSQLPNPQNL